jgi:bisphosphoglycerate-independent phosphoglycerate mutase (AlkP superfamily)
LERLPQSNDGDDEMKTTIELAREAGFETMITKGKIHGFDRDGDYTEELKAFEALVRADEREQGQKWFDAVTAQHKQLILAEREACAKVCENDAWRCKKIAVETQDKKANAAALEAYLCAEAIRARGQA